MPAETHRALLYDNAIFRCKSHKSIKNKIVLLKDYKDHDYNTYPEFSVIFPITTNGYDFYFQFHFEAYVQSIYNKTLMSFTLMTQMELVVTDFLSLSLKSASSAFHMR